jgi:hypothetical protein
LRRQQPLPAVQAADIHFAPEMDLLPLCYWDIEAVWRRLRGLGARDGTTHVASLPSPAQLRWHFAREWYQCEALLGRRKGFINCGAQRRVARAESCGCTTCA